MRLSGVGRILAGTRRPLLAGQRDLGVAGEPSALVVPGGAGLMAAPPVQPVLDAGGRGGGRGAAPFRGRSAGSCPGRRAGGPGSPTLAGTRNADSARLVAAG